MKIIYWIIGIIVAVVILFAGYHFWRPGSSERMDNPSNANSSTTSGTGNNNHNPLQEIQKHLEKGQLPLPGAH